MFSSRTVLAAGGVTLAAFVGAVVAPGVSASADDTTAVVRSAHFSPDTAGVDVYLAPVSGGSTQLWVSDEGYGSLSAYRRITPGVYVVSMRPHDAPVTTAPTVTWTLDAKAGSAYTAAAIGTRAALQAVLLTDDLAAPAAGTGRVRIVDAASQAPSVSVIANGGVNLAKDLPFGSTSGYTAVPTGTWDVRATPSTGSTSSVTASVAVAPGSSSTVAVLDKPGGGISLLSVQDAASTGVAPAGPVNAGAGGTATRFTTEPASTPAGTTWGIAGAVALLGLIVLGRRVRGR